MSNDNKTLADVQPGGRVRLGDQAERARFEAWVKNHVSSLARAADGEYASNFTHALWSAWQAALSAQPSRGGQGDAPPCWWIDHGTYGQITQRQDEADAAVNAGKRVVSYAARQPVGEPEIWVSPGQLEELKRRPAGQGSNYLPTRLASEGNFTQPLYAVPTAQAVDLGRWSQRHADDLHVAVHTALSVHAGSLSQKKRAFISAYVKRLLIDSQAVGNG